MWKYSGLMVLVLFVSSYALNCGSEGRFKQEEFINLVKIYRDCLKRQSERNTTNRNYDNNWDSNRSRNWNREVTYGNTNERDSDRTNRDRDDRMNRDEQSYDYRTIRRTNYDDRMGSREYDRTDRYSRDDRTDRTYSRDDRGRDDDRMDGTGSSSYTGYSDMDRGRNNGYGNNGYGNNGYGRSQISGRDDFQQSDESESDPYGFRSSTSSPRRYKRAKGTNSGQRSQYNPNPSPHRPFDDPYARDDRNNGTGNMSVSEHVKACALQCFLENIRMTGHNGMPDRYLVTHQLTQDVKNSDLKNFLEEATEECFQIVENEGTEDKCEFSKNLLECFNEKGRENCDDWMYGDNRPSSCARPRRRRKM